MDYLTWHKRSLSDPDNFWDEAAQRLTWFEKYQQVFSPGESPSDFRWFAQGKLNLAYNCLDRQVDAGRGEQIAYHFIDEDGRAESITYVKLLDLTSRIANVLRAQGVNKGDRVAIYFPASIEHIATMLACARIGAIHSVVFAGFSATALQTRLQDTGAKLIITATHTRRRGRNIDLLSTTRQARQDCPDLKSTIIWNRHSGPIELEANELDWAQLVSQASPECAAESMDSEDPLFILYTSGTTGKPKGIVHTTGGYTTAALLTTTTSFNLKEGDVYWCTADPGWITGHTYVAYGPLLAGITSVIAEGTPDFPDASRWWKIIEKFKVNIWYTVPTAVRLLMHYGNNLPLAHRLGSLRVIGSVGEPISPIAWNWLSEVVGQNRASVIDTWWQTETGSHALVTLPHLPQKPGVAGLPFAGIDADVVDDHGHSVPHGTKGYLVIKKPWPSAMRTCWNDRQRYQQYWQKFPGYYFSGDMAIADSDGYIQVLGRSDDVLNISGHRLGTAEIEGALAAHESVAEAAAVALPDDMSGEKLHAFVLLKEGVHGGSQLEHELREQVKKQIGRFAHVADFTFTSQLPKTRSGKLMRRVLRAQALGENPGDLSTLED